MKQIVFLIFAAALSQTTFAQWQIVSEHDGRQSLPGTFPSQGRQIKIGDEWPHDQRFRWLIAELEIPETLAGKPTAGKAVGLQFNCGDGGEIYVGR